MHAKIFAVSFSACGFFLSSIMSVVSGADLYASFKRGLIVLCVCWVVGYLLGIVFSSIINEKRSSSNNREGIS